MLEVMIDFQGLQTESRLRGIGRSISEILNQLIIIENDIRWHFLINSASLNPLVSSVVNFLLGAKDLLNSVDAFERKRCFSTMNFC